MRRFSNRRIVEELKGKSRFGYRRLNDLYRSRLVREAVASYKVAREDAEEIVNDVLLTVTERIGGFEFKECDTDFHRWVMTIFRNKVRDHVRRRSITDGLQSNFDESLFEAGAPLSDAESEVLAAIIRNYHESGIVHEQPSGFGRILDAAAEVLEKMEVWERVLLKCRVLHVPYDEIARYTGKSANQLKVYHSRVRRKFLKLLHEQHPSIFAKWKKR